MSETKPLITHWDTMECPECDMPLKEAHFENPFMYGGYDEVGVYCKSCGFKDC